jgi:hypothetical protein
MWVCDAVTLYFSRKLGEGSGPIALLNSSMRNGTLETGFDKTVLPEFELVVFRAAPMAVITVGGPKSASRATLCSGFAIRRERYHVSRYATNFLASVLRGHSA